MEKKIGFVGCGNMAKAIIKGLLESGIKKENLIASATKKSTLDQVENSFGIKTTLDNIQVAKESDIIILAVKPHLYEMVIKEISEAVKDQIIVSIAPGKTLETLEAYLGKSGKIVRTMPNTPSMVGFGMTAICYNSNIIKKEKKLLVQMLETFSVVEEIEEKLFDAVVSISGSSPAYIYMLIEAMADAGVLQGLPRDKAYKFAAQAVIGSGKMVLETGIHPGKLKDMVCSPGGTTIEAVRELERKGFRASVMDAMEVCAIKSAKM